MTQDEIIEMLAKVYGVAWTSKAQLRDLTAFAKLVAQHEREACAKVCDAVAQQMDDEGEGPTGSIGWVDQCSKAIRERK